MITKVYDSAFQNLHDFNIQIIPVWRYQQQLIQSTILIFQVPCLNKKYQIC